jgi:hypothetical protein
MTNRLESRVRRLERSRFFQHPPDPFDEIVRVALQQISDEDLALLISVARVREAGLYRTLSQSECAAEEAYRAALDVKCPAGQRR